MDDAVNDRFLIHRDLANRCFAEWVPPQCHNQWLERISGPARFPWDLEAIQAGFVEPIYRVHAARPERWRPILAIALLRSLGLDVERYSSMIAAVELQYLATAMLACIRNGRTIADATPTELDIPLPVLSTVAFTAGSFAANLISYHTPYLPLQDRLWLISRCASNGCRAGAGFAVDNHDTAAPARPNHEAAYALHLQLCVSPTFTFPVDCVMAALGETAAPATRQLRSATSSMGAAYHLASEVLMSLRPPPPADLMLPLEPRLRWTYTEALAGPSGDAVSAHQCALAMAEKFVMQARDGLAGLRQPLHSAYLEFMEATCLDRLWQAKEAVDAQ